MSKFVKDCPAFIIEDMQDDMAAIFQRLRAVCPISSLDDSRKDKFICKLYLISTLAINFQNTVNDFLNDYGKQQNSN